jgi:hypothetical protein
MLPSLDEKGAGRSAKAIAAAHCAASLSASSSMTGDDVQTQLNFKHW